MGTTGSSMHNTYPGQRQTSRSMMQPNPNYVRNQNNTNIRRGSTTAPSSSSSPTSNNSNNNNDPSQPPAARTLSTPGAYSISRNSTASNEVFRVRIPQNIRPNQEFPVYAGSRVVRVRCPPNSRPGQDVQITIPPEDLVTRTSTNVAVLTSADDSFVGGGAVRMDSETRLVNNSIHDRGSANSGSGSNHSNTNNNMPPPSAPAPTPAPPQQQPQMQAYNVRVPSHARPGQTFSVSVNGQTVQVQCPPNARPGMNVQINFPSTNPPSRSGPPPGMQSATNLSRPPPGGISSNNGSNNTHANSNSSPTRTVTQMFEVTVPRGVRPGQPFSLMAGGQRVLVSCPSNARAGSRIRFQLPMSVPGNGNSNSNSTSSTAGSSGGGGNGRSSKSSGGNDVMEGVALKYDTQDGWIRTVRVTDMKFTWIKLDENGEIVSSTSTSKFDVHNSAFVRKLLFLQGNDPRMRTGKLSLVPASEYSLDSDIIENGKKVIDCAELSKIQTQKFDKKTGWFLGACKKLGVPWEEGHMRIAVRRNNLLSDSINAVMSLSREDMRKIWRFEFMGEMGIDAGGLAKEWFLLVTQAIFDADSGLWLSSEGNQMLMRINPASEISCPEDHLIYFRFLGRVLGKALVEGQIVAGHMVQYLYKYMLGWPITFDDLESIDVELYQNLKKILAMNPDEVEYMCLDFTATQNSLGETHQIKLTPEGEDKAVTGENLHEYLELYFKYLMLERIRPQVTELLLGFYDVVPEPMLTIFDFQELELMMCGLPTIDMADWKKHTQYAGTFASSKQKSQVCKWFWEVVSNEFDQEMRARLLQFVTGTSGVPSRGFSVLQGSDGNIKLFTLNGVDMKTTSYPRSHTCFNRLDLPIYRSKKDLREKLKIAVRECATGFTME